MNAIEVLSELKINTTSCLRAVQDANHIRFEDNTYRRLIGQLTGSDDVNVGDDEARHTFLYLVEEIVKEQKTDSIDLASAHNKALKFVKANPWATVKPEYTSYYKPKTTVDALGNPRQKKGAKKAKAIKFWNENRGKFNTRKEWIEALMENVGLTEAAASTYHYNLKKGVWK